MIMVSGIRGAGGVAKMIELPPRPEHPRNYGVSNVLGYLKELEKWAVLAEKRIKELENNLGAWVK